MGTGSSFRYRPPTWLVACTLVVLGGLALFLRTLHAQQHVAQAAAQEQFERRKSNSVAVEVALPTVNAVAAEALAVSLSSPPSTLPPPPPAPSPAAGQCVERPHLEYDGDVMVWGSNNIQPDTAACCEACHSQRKRAEARGERGCSVWVFCAKEGGCGTQKVGECWLKRGATPLPQARARGPGCDWTSGEAMSPAEAAAMTTELARVAEVERGRRERPGNPRVYLDVEVEGNRDVPKSRGRLEFVLYAHESPRHAENFRVMCSGERGGKLTFKGMKFYRIIDMFIDQAGVQGVQSIWGSSFDDDPGGLALKHDKAGLLSAANSGPNFNSGHFSVVVSPAPHLNGGYTVFGELVAGFDTMWAINKLTTKGTDRVTGSATVVESGCLSNCEPRLEVGPKCKTKATQRSTVQGKSILACVD